MHLTSTQIRQLTRLTPRNSSELDPSGIGQVISSKLAKLPYAPDFGWRFVNAFLETGRRLPETVTNSIFHRLYDCRNRPDLFEDFSMDQVIGIAQSDNMFPTLIKAYLMVKDISFEQIADNLKLPLEYLEIFHTLFFNVRGRLDDPMFITNLLYPNGRQMEFQDNYLRHADWSLILLRCVYHNDFAAFSYFSGFKKLPKEIDAQDALRVVESMIMSGAVVSGEHLGGMNQRSNTGFNNAKNLISSAKIGGAEDKKDEDLDPALGGGDIGQSLMDEMVKYHGEKFKKLREEHENK